MVPAEHHNLTRCPLDDDLLMCLLLAKSLSWLVRMPVKQM
jgi:hypothetical protein